MCQNLDLKYFPLRQTAALLMVSRATVKRWVRDGQIEARRQPISGCSYRLVFSEKEIARYIDMNWPTLRDLDYPPKSERAFRIKQIITAKRRHLEKAKAARADCQYRILAET